MKIRPTILGTMALIAVWAVFYVTFVVPGIEVRRRHSAFYVDGLILERPFWPQYWRYLRGRPEPSDVGEIYRSDDGGILVGTALVALGLFVLAWRFREALFKDRSACPRPPGNVSQNERSPNHND